jgi:ferric-dicitrate binding protein FerR (iron transport regulator)
MPKTQVKVLGTQFIVQSAEDGATVQVEEGKVAFYEKRNSEENQAILLAGDEATNVYDGDIITTTIVDRNYLAWKTRKLFFNGEPLAMVCVKIGEVYGVQLTIEPESGGNCAVTVDFDNEPLEAVLETIETLIGGKFRLEDGIYHFDGGDEC